MKSAKDLEFHEIESENAPEFVCNACGKTYQGFGSFMADVRLTDTSEIMITVCSMKCAEDYKNHPAATKHLIDLGIRILLNSAKK